MMWCGLWWCCGFFCGGYDVFAFTPVTRTGVVPFIIHIHGVEDDADHVGVIALKGMQPSRRYLTFQRS